MTGEEAGNFGREPRRLPAAAFSFVCWVGFLDFWSWVGLGVRFSSFFLCVCFSFLALFTGGYFTFS